MTDDEKWNNSFQELIIFRKKNNRYPNASSDNKEEQKLARWVGKQRNIYNNGLVLKDGSRRLAGILKSYQIEKLKAYGFEFNAKRAKWDNRYDEFIEFIDKNHRIPSSIVDKEKQLKHWEVKQIYIIENGKLSEDGSITVDNRTLTKHQVKKMKMLIDKVKKIDNYDYYYTWNNIYNKMLVFIKACGRLPQKNNTNEDENNLALWYEEQKNVVKLGKTLEDGTIKLEEKYLSKSMYKRLLSLSNPTAIIEKFENDWYSKLGELKDFIRVNHRYPKNGGDSKENSLASWFHRQKAIYNKGTMLENGSIVYNSSALTSNMIRSLKEMGINFVELDKAFQRKKWNNREEYLAKLRYVKDKLQLLTKEDKTFEKEEDTAKFNKHFQKILTK